MKRFFALILALVFIPLFASADFENCPDVSGLSYVELMYMYGSVQRALWACEEWTSVDVPAGVYKIGESIPAGHWSIQPVKSNDFYMITYGSKLDITGASIDYDSIDGFWTISSDLSDSMLRQLDIVLTDGYYIELGHASHFIPYVGKQIPGFNFD